MPPSRFHNKFFGGIKSSSFAFVALLLIASLSLNILLGRRLRQLAILLPSQQSPLEVGVAVPPIVAKGLDGRDQTITYIGSGRLTVLYVFTPQCAWCARNLDNLKALLKSKGAQERFVGLSLSQPGLADYVRANELTIPVLTALSADTIRAYRLGATPQTLVISPEGRVLENWRGAWINKQKSDIEVFFNVSLPGIQIASSSSH